MVRFISIIGGIFFLLIGAIFISRIVGNTKKSATVNSLRKYICVESYPCWNTIHLGETSLDETEVIIYNSNFEVTQVLPYELCWKVKELWTGCLFYGPDNVTGKNIVTSVEIYPRNLRLGEAILLFGKPVASTLCWTHRFRNGVTPIINAKVYFKDPNIIVTAIHSRRYPAQYQRFEPDMIVEKIIFYVNPMPSYQPGLPWRGFIKQSLVQGCGN